MTIATGFWVRNYKGFKELGAGIECIKPINVIIGKNNIGKSSLVEAVEHLFRGRGGNSAIGESVEYCERLSEDQVRAEFSMMARGGELPGQHWNDHGNHFVDKRVFWREQGTTIDVFRVEDILGELVPGEKSRLANAIHKAKKTGVRHIKLDADRDLVREQSTNELSLAGNGVGGTNIVQMYITSSALDRDLIQTRLLTALNDIFSPDTVFTEIVVQRHSDNGTWEIYLGEEGKGLVPLSASGSGLKTVILTLLNLLVRPDFEKKSIDSYVFSFEELENNLHPSLQRNLFSFLLDFARSSQCHIFLTTHSQVAIDLFHGEEDAQILHVRKQGRESVGVVLDDLVRGYSVLDDLGAKASDILQANGIIWVEGPSDRVYLNKFIELWGGGAYKEGHHYQFIYYGGSVLANVSVATPDAELQEAVNAMRINRNFIFVCDSDRRHKRGALKSRVTELLSEIAVGRGHVWVSKCREIENYIPKESFESVHNVTGLPQIGEYEYVQDYLRKHRLSEAAEFSGKHHKAVKYSDFFSKNNLSFRPELEVELNQIIERIMSWNS